VGIFDKVVKDAEEAMARDDPGLGQQAGQLGDGQVGQVGQVGQGMQAAQNLIGKQRGAQDQDQGSDLDGGDEDDGDEDW
jgi:hypothetical protein